MQDLAQLEYISPYEFEAYARDGMLQTLSKDVEYVVILLKRDNSLIKKVLLFSNQTTSNYETTKAIVKASISPLVSAIVVQKVVKGKLTYNDKDIEFAWNLQKALALFNILLLDYEFINSTTFVSLLNDGVL